MAKEIKQGVTIISFFCGQAEMRALTSRVATKIMFLIVFTFFQFAEIRGPENRELSDDGASNNNHNPFMFNKVTNFKLLIAKVSDHS